jgi:Flp pilus assembly protein CpaB
VRLAERLFATRRGALLTGLGIAVLAGVLLFVYVRQYRSHTSASAATTSVLVARNLIQKGTPGAVVASQHLYVIRQVAKADVKLGAYTDPQSLEAGVSLTDIPPGSQILGSFFGSPTNVLDTEISGGQRALSMPIDATRTLQGQIASGDHIDIYYSASGKIVEILQNVTVLGLSTGGGEITLQVSPLQAGRLMLATDTGKLWFTLRAKVGVPHQAPVIVAPDSLTTGQ